MVWRRKGKIQWKALERNKGKIADYKRRYGTQRAIYFAEGILWLKRGEFTKYRPRIRKFVKKL